MIPSQLELTHGLLMSQPTSGHYVPLPPDHEALVGRSESALSNIIEGIEIVSPRCQVHRAIDFVRRTPPIRQCGEPLNRSPSISDVVMEDGKMGKTAQNEKATNISVDSLLILCRRRPTLPHTFACSTIGPAGLNFRVRDGNGWNPRGKITANLTRLWRGC